MTTQTETQQQDTTMPTAEEVIQHGQEVDAAAVELRTHILEMSQKFNIGALISAQVEMLGNTLASAAHIQSMSNEALEELVNQSFITAEAQAQAILKIIRDKAAA